MKKIIISTLIGFSILNISFGQTNEKKVNNEIVLYKYKNKDGVYIYSNEKPTDPQIKYEIIKK